MHYDMGNTTHVNNTYSSDLQCINRNIATENHYSEKELPLTPEQQADWMASIKHDINNPNRGKVHRDIDNFWQKLEATF
ncbi:MAG: hypothetical protein IJU81_07985 [Bacteroidales bacterium]|nr:hypothetical protein [Bacteroidales bacterium]